jgi:hypothetical protein
METLVVAHGRIVVDDVERLLVNYLKRHDMPCSRWRYPLPLTTHGDGGMVIGKIFAA